MSNQFAVFTRTRHLRESPPSLVLNRPAMFTCTISREVCRKPVISKKTGHIFEKELITKHLNSTGKCPITSQDMTTDDLIDVQGYSAPAPPRNPTHSQSIPALLRTMQNEWDALMLDSYKLKKHCHEMRQQLSHSLYQYDAACRVIARLTQERDRALELSEGSQKVIRTQYSQVQYVYVHVYPWPEAPLKRALKNMF